MANYLALLFADTAKNTDHTLRVWLTRYREQPRRKKSDDRYRPSPDIGALELGTRLNSSKSPLGFEQVIYSKGAWVIHMLREMLRQPNANNPDERFHTLLHTLIPNTRTAPYRPRISSMKSKPS